MNTYRVASTRLIGRDLGTIVTSDDYTAGEIDFMVKAGLLELVTEDAPKPPRRARTKITTTEQE